MVAREAPHIVPKRIGLTFRASDNKFLERVLFEKRGTLVSDVAIQNARVHERADIYAAELEAACESCTRRGRR